MEGEENEGAPWAPRKPVVRKVLGAVDHNVAVLCPPPVFGTPRRPPSSPVQLLCSPPEVACRLFEDDDMEGDSSDLRPRPPPASVGCAIKRTTSRADGDALDSLGEDFLATLPYAKRRPHRGVELGERIAPPPSAYAPPGAWPGCGGEMEGLGE